ncbi:MAG TPA: sirohydrochlorin chelatase [Ktedonobacteraceae bacterium]
MEINGTLPLNRTGTSDLPERVARVSDEAIVLMAHGSRDTEGAKEFLTFANRLASRLAHPIYAGFLELADPPVISVIDEARRAGARTIFAIPWLLLGAGHAKNDLPIAIQWARQRYPQVTIRYGSPINVQPELLAILADRLAAIDPDEGRGSPTTAVLLVQRGSSDPDANAEVYRAARLLWEGRNYRTVEVAFSGITWPTVSEGLQRCLVHGVSRVLVVPYYLYTGILVKRIEQTVAEMATIHPECEFRVAQHMGQDTRLDILAQRMIEQTRNGKATMSCDMCQYRVPLVGREALVGLPQVSDHAHGLRGTTMNDHTHEEHHHIHHEENDEYKHEHIHSHEHTHDHGSSSALDAWKALCECVTTAGIMNMQEITAALTAQQSKQRKKPTATTLMPYILTAMPGQPPTSALRWDFDSRRVHEFADWCTTALRERFGINWQIEYEDEDAQLGPQSLRILQDGLQEQCDWRYLNQSHWMGAFCTIANRLLEPTGITALCLETGWFDTVVLFCHKNHAEELLNWFSEAE